MKPSDWLIRHSMVYITDTSELYNTYRICGPNYRMLRLSERTDSLINYSLLILYYFYNNITNNCINL